jgi:hypothetical protein
VEPGDCPSWEEMETDGNCSILVSGIPRSGRAVNSITGTIDD